MNGWLHTLNLQSEVRRQSYPTSSSSSLTIIHHHYFHCSSLEIFLLQFQFPISFLGDKYHLVRLAYEGWRIFSLLFLFWENKRRFMRSPYCLSCRVNFRWSLPLGSTVILASESLGLKHFTLSLLWESCCLTDWLTTTLLLALASTMILGSESHGTHDHITADYFKSFCTEVTFLSETGI
jgi:hypothetical protein